MSANSNLLKKPLELLRRLARVRMADWALYALLLTAVVWLMVPQQLPVAVYKLTLLALAAVSSYWIDRSMFPYARPDVLLLGHAPPRLGLGAETTFTDLRDVVQFTEAAAQPSSPLDVASDHDKLLLGALCMLRRAVVVGCAMLAVGLGA